MRATRAASALMVVAVLTGSAACGGSAAAPSAPTTPVTTVPPQPQANATPGPPAPPPIAAAARYTVTFEATWSAATHPTAFPRSAHFSSLIGVTHASGVHFWSPGAIASDGIEAMG